MDDMWLGYCYDCSPVCESVDFSIGFLSCGIIPTMRQVRFKYLRLHEQLDVQREFRTGCGHQREERPYFGNTISTRVPCNVRRFQAQTLRQGRLDFYRLSGTRQGSQSTQLLQIQVQANGEGSLTDVAGDAVRSLVALPF